MDPPILGTNRLGTRSVQEGNRWRPMGPSSGAAGSRDRIGGAHGKCRVFRQPTEFSCSAFSIVRYQHYRDLQNPSIEKSRTFAHDTPPIDKRTATRIFCLSHRHPPTPERRTGYQVRICAHTETTDSFPNPHLQFGNGSSRRLPEMILVDGGWARLSPSNPVASHEFLCHPRSGSAAGATTGDWEGARHGTHSHRHVRQP